MITNLEKLQKRIIEEVPEIVELKFGCKIKRYTNPRFKERSYKVIEDIGFAGNSDKVWINSVPFGSMQIPIEILKSEVGDNTGNWIIIGRDINIEDILYLQGQIDLNFDGLLGIVDNEFWFITSKKSYGLGIYWTLNKPLHLQTQTTIDFLTEIIL